MLFGLFFYLFFYFCSATLPTSWELVFAGIPHSCGFQVSGFAFSLPLEISFFFRPFFFVKYRASLALKMVTTVSQSSVNFTATNYFLHFIVTRLELKMKSI